MMKLAASVSLAALALAGCATAQSQPVPPPPMMAAEGPASAAAVPADGLPYPLTVEGARSFIADVEKDLYDFSVIGGRAAWVNATYINDDTDALNAYFGTIGTEKGVKYASQAAKYAAVPGLDFDTARKLNILRGALVLAAPHPRPSRGCCPDPERPARNCRCLLRRSREVNDFPWRTR